jgi:hypothetical protein
MEVNMIEGFLGFLAGSAFWSLLGKYLMQKDQQIFAEKLELTKAELEGIKSTLRQYSEGQFDEYRDLWSALCDLKVAADDLWNAATPSKADAFLDKLSETRLSLEKSSLLVEREHYQRLTNLLNQFNEFWHGKQALIDLRLLEDEDQRVLQDRRRQIVEGNGFLVNEYSQTLDELRGYFQAHLRGANTNA